jgi:hypothetical protein
MVGGAKQWSVGTVAETITTGRPRAEAPSGLVHVEAGLGGPWASDREDGTRPLRASPSFTRVNLWAEWVVPVLALRAGLEPAAYFGWSSARLNYDAYEADFSKQTRDARRDEQAGFGGRAYLAPSLRVRAGRVVATSTAELEWWAGDADGPYYYEPARDTLLEADGDALWTLTSVVLYEREGRAGRKLALGANHRLLRVVDAPANDVQRLGGLLSWTLGERRFGVRQPTLLANVGV